MLPRTRHASSRANAHTTNTTHARLKLLHTIYHTLHTLYTRIPPTYQKAANNIDLYYFINTKTEQVPIIDSPISGIWQVIEYYIRNTTLYTTANDMVPTENNLLITCAQMHLEHYLVIHNYVSNINSLYFILKSYTYI